MPVAVELERQTLGRLELSDGTKFDGVLYGSCSCAAGEVVFQTGVVGYIESLSDPSYHSQILILTYPSIGNYGVPAMDELDEHELPRWFESKCIYARALVVSELCIEYSHFAAKMSIDEWLKEQRVTCLSNVDTRALTLKLRQHGTMLGRIYPISDEAQIPGWYDPSVDNLAAAVSSKTKKIFNHAGDVHVAVIDCGLKLNQIRCFIKRGAKVTVLPFDTDLSLCTETFDALFISNGPGDPAHCSHVTTQISQWMKQGKPLFGICLGHQLVARAIGLETYKMKYGNRGHNQPCIHLKTGRCFITSQNHGYAVDASSLPDGWYELFRNANDQSNEGLAHHTEPWMSVQFHPEHMAGPQDLEILFDIFLKHVRSPAEATLSDRITEAIHYEQLPFEKALTARNNRPQKVLLLGSGGLSIGQAGEFDYSGSQALKALREECIQTLLVNPNVATVQTTAGMADKIFLLPVTPECVSRVIEAERPDGIIISFGGQTGLTCGLALATPGPSSSVILEQGDINLTEPSVLETWECRLIGTPASTTEITEDRQKFAEAMHSIGEQVAPAGAAHTVREAVEVGDRLGYPVLIRAAFALGGMGSGFADNAEQLEVLAQRALSQTTQIFIDKSLKGWKEVEYEVLRDAYNNCITVCNMENVDPVGIHTGESIVVAPSQTLSNVEYNMLRSVAIKVARHLHIVGECNIQFALDPNSLTYYIIEVNARLSRSSALASKATGYPLAYIAAKLCLGRSLAELTNVVTGDLTTACFEPSLDYCVVKVPRWDLSKFTRITRHIGSSMKSVGEVMAISRCFEEAIQKALRMTDQGALGFDGRGYVADEEVLVNPTDQRIYVLAAALQQGYSVDRLSELTNIDRWFLHRFMTIVQCQKRLSQVPDSTVKKLVTLLADGSVELHTHNPDHSVFVPLYLICCAKRLGFSDIQIAHAIQSSALSISLLRERLNMGPTVRQVDTVAGEWPATTNYLYVSYADLPLAEVIRCRELTGAENVLDGFRMAVSPVGKHDVDFQPHTSIMVLGSGVYRIGSSVEFDWCAVGCVRELRRLGWPTVMLNCNPETVSTDFDMCDRLYFDELSLERVLDIFKLEISVGVIVSMGGQTPNNIVMPAHRLGVPILGTSAESIDTAENRFKFSRLLDCMGISQPRWKELTDLESARAFCREVGYPCLVRPSYVLSGAAMNVAYDDQDLVSYLSTAKSISPELPVVITQFILDAKEIDVDAVAQSGRLIALAVSEHVENAGVHSGDATLVTPPQDLNLETLDRIRELVVALADELQVSGPFNLQLIAKDNRLQIIEANLRVSRSLPFVSKTLKYDFVAAATRCILGSARESIYPSGAENLSGSRGFMEPVVDVTAGISGHVGVKVPVFSFSRLLGAEVLLGVEMVSTGEVACFGQDRYEAYLLAQTAALCNTNGRLPKPRENIFLSIGSYRHKVELMTSISQLSRLGYVLYGSCGTADFYQTQGISIIPLQWPFEDSEAAKSFLPQNCDVDTRERTVQQYLTEKQFALIVSLTMRKTGYRRQSAFVTRGYMTRRLAVETNVPLITDVKLVKLLAEALYRHYGGRIPSELEVDGSLLPIRKTSTEVDHSKLSRLLPIRCITSSRILFLPGLVDIHVHTRDPGHEYKEDWSTATVSALAGGVVTVFAMPNTDPAVIDETSLHLAAERAATRAYCDYGLYVGATADNPTSVVQLSRHAIGLKMYLNETFTTLSLAGRMDVWRKHFESWPANRPICCHAEGETIAAILLLAELTNRAVHICHVSRKSEIELIRDAKARGLKVTCEVCPHHLFLTLDDMPKEGGWAEVRPRLGTREDIEALWANLSTIDCFATDHAPHLASEKARDKNAPPGFPGLETMLPLLLTAMCEGRLTLVDLIERLHVNPLRIFGLAAYADANDALDRCTYGDTWVEVDLSSEWYLPGAYTYQTPVAKMPTSGSTPTLYTRAGWSPFAGRRVRGRVRRVMLRGSLVFVDNRVLVKPGYGMNVMNRPVASSNLTLEQPTVDTVERPVPPVVTSSSPSPRIRMDSCSERIWEEIVQHTSFSVQTVAPSGVTGPSTSANQLMPGASGTSVGSHNLWLDGISGKHVLSSGSFTKTALHRLFNLAHSFRQAVLKSRPLDSICRGKVMASLFFEPSTRTCNSFTVAMQRLGGSVVHFTESLSSLSKGETLADTFRILASYSDCLVVRHPGQGAIQTASTLVNKPIINAGDGVGEHPTQALLDVFTIREEIGTVNNLTVTMVGDLANGRTVHSLARLLCLYNVRLRYVTHCDELRMPEDVKAYVASRGIQQEEMSSLVEALPETDVLYMTRVQAERMRSGDSCLLAENQFVITPELMTLAKPTGMIVMHPLPRVGEISSSFDSDPRAAYFRQAEYGMYVRMALLAILLADPKH
ncbi:Carbamoyl-phosphate synthetase (Glutamine-hydrolysing) [Fasciola gigantica]|uniref:Carbamoyl phosphate synthase arginine-specific large chain n=1 Tax=Fasciola gigantica TaxID=46835 RepID=A0A504YRV8_FASGI|nr:Carbamoyl-phosphate synthetase (Glutamine-hydrolysing) [Fasciola gigantica]